MPQKDIDLTAQIPYLSILDAENKLDEDLEPDMSEELLLELHRCMLLTRRFDERMLNLQRQGRIGTFGPVKGQEASQLGAAAVLEDRDWLVPSFREMGAEIWRGKKLVNILLSYGGFNEGGALPEETTNLPVCIPVATQLPHAVGIAYAAKYREQDCVVMVFFGDGATSEGDFHEALNFAGVFQAPVVFVCQNNQWAISTPRSRQSRSQTLAQKALAYGIPGRQVDGNDLLAVYAAASEAAARARDGKGPTLIECITYRLAVHTTADDPKRYRTDEEVEQWEQRDPLKRFQAYLKNKDILSDEKIESVEADVKAEIKKAVEEYEQAAETLGNPLDMFKHVYAELPVYLSEQKAELERELAQREKNRPEKGASEHGENDNDSSN